MGVYNVLRYHLVPPVFLILFTGSIQIFALYGCGRKLTLGGIKAGMVGNAFSWIVVTLFIMWAIFWLRLTKKIISGPMSPDGDTPTYKGCGLLYYISSVAIYLFLDCKYPILSSMIYQNMPHILGTLNVMALTLCLYLFNKSDCTYDRHLPTLYLFYRGRDFHPKLFDLDVKQLTNSRIGVMLWQLLPLTFFLASLKETSTFNVPAFVTLLLQSVYVFKFFVWEEGYYHTLDITLDRAGYYLCWGCVVWIPCFFTYTSYYFVRYPPTMSNTQSIACAIVGLIAIFVQYKIDQQKKTFRSQNGKCLIWGKIPQYITAFYTEPSTGKEEISLLLLSGYWGLARHMNYTMEIIISFALSAPGFSTGVPPYFYPTFMVYLLLHRVLRDDEKCQEKYRKYWTEYCNKVPYTLVPYIF